MKEQSAAGILEATIEKVIEDTVARFFDCQDKTSRKLTICIRPKDFLDVRADMKKIEKYISYKCEFG